MSWDSENGRATDVSTGPKRLLRYVFSALVASSLCLLIYEPDLLFLGYLIIAFYLALFVLHALCVRSLAINVMVVLIFWFLPFPIEIIDRYCKFRDWGTTFSYLTVSGVTLQLAIVGIHLLFQSGLVFVFWALRKAMASDGAT
jgi:hypothetical protein